MTYTQAVEKACNGDSTGFEFLYDTTKNNKYYLALKYVKDEEAAKDVLQEAYIRAWKNLDYHHLMDGIQKSILICCGFQIRRASIG